MSKVSFTSIFLILIFHISYSSMKKTDVFRVILTKDVILTIFDLFLNLEEILIDFHHFA